MITKDNMLTSISKEIEQELGKPGTPERAKFDEEAYAFYTGQLLSDARKEAKVTQAELARDVCMLQGATLQEWNAETSCPVQRCSTI